MPLKDPEARRKYINEWNRLHSGRSREWAKGQTRRRRAVLAAIKLTAGCVDCGYDRHPEALDFDHRPGTEKKYNPSQMCSSHWSLKRIFEELEKCDVRCANCHRVMTANRRDHS